MLNMPNGICEGPPKKKPKKNKEQKGNPGKKQPTDFVF
jgi:hypothetical protein